MKVISIGFGRDIFEKDSEAQRRAIAQSSLFEELHIIVFSLDTHHLPSKLQIAPNAWVYSTNAPNSFFYITSAVSIGMEILGDSKIIDGKDQGSWIITAQDPFEAGLAAYRLAKKTEVKLHLQVHTDVLSPYFKRHSILNCLRVKLARFLLPKADGIRVVSSRIKNSLETALKLKAIPYILPVFVDVERIKNAPLAVDLREKYSEYKHIILVAGRLSKEKNIRLALQAFSAVSKVHPEVGMVIVGSGPEESSLKHFVKRHGLKTNVFFESWTKDIFSYYKTADLFLQTSRYEGNSRAIIEAVFSNIPIVSTDVGISGEILQGKFSSVCPVGDQKCLSEKISYFLEHEEERKEISNTAREKLEKIIHSDKDKYLEEYRRSFQTV